MSRKVRKVYGPDRPSRRCCACTRPFTAKHAAYMPRGTDAVYCGWCIGAINHHNQWPKVRHKPVGVN